MSNVARFEAGPLNRWEQWSFKHPMLSKAAPGKLFLGDKLQLSGMEVSLNTLPAGKEVPFYHRHHYHEELYLILSGSGEFQVDDERLSVSEGSALRIAPSGERTWRNNGTSPLVYLVIQAVEGSIHKHQIDDGEVTNREVAW